MLQGGGATFCSKMSRSLCVGPLKEWLWESTSLGLRIKKWTPECSCVSKGVGATFCSKTGRFFLCGPTKPFGAMSAPKSRGHVLQQNRAVLCVWPH